MLFLLLRKNQVSTNGFRRTAADAIHFLYPLRWSFRFQMFGQALLLSVSFYQLKKEGLQFFRNISEVGVELAGSEQVTVENFMVLL